jgi:hypothetical protein
VEGIIVLRKYKNKLEKKKPMLAGERILYPVGAVNSQFGEFTVEESRRTELEDCIRASEPSRRLKKK